MAQVIIYTFAENSTTIVNHGSRGSDYNATANRNMYVVRNGHGTYGAFATMDYICIPSGMYNSYPGNNTHSWEFGIFVNQWSGTYEKIWDKGIGAFFVGIQEFGGIRRFYIYRTTSGGGARYFHPMNTEVHLGHNYYVQISWAAGSNPASCPYPHIHIATDGGAPVHQSTFDPDTGSGSGSWYDDRTMPPQLANYSYPNCSATNGHYNFDGYFWIWREYDEAINWDNAGNWATDHLLWGTSQPTSMTLTAVPTDVPSVGQTIDLIATLYSGGSPLAGKSVRLSHWFNGVQYVDATQTTNGSGQISYYISFGSTGIREFYADFYGDSGYQASESTYYITVVPGVTTVYPGRASLEFAPRSPLVYESESIPITAPIAEAHVRDYPPVIVNYNDVVCQPSVLGIEPSARSPTTGIGITTTAAMLECDAGIVYPDILEKLEFVFPVSIISESLAVAPTHTLSTEVHPLAVSPEVDNTLWAPLEISFAIDTTAAEAEAYEEDPYHTYIDNPSYVEVDAILTDELAVSGIIAKEVTLGRKIVEEVTLVLEIPYE